MDLRCAIARLLPRPQFFGGIEFNTKEEYEALDWRDKRTKPSWEEILASGFEVAKELKKAELAEARWLEETGGITLPNDVVIETDDRSQLKLLSTVMTVKEKVKDNPDLTIRWKGTNGWLPVTASEIIVVGDYVFNYIQALFNKEDRLSALVDSCQSIEEVKAITWA